MKKLLLLPIIFIACQNNVEHIEYGCRIITLDSCEYIQKGDNFTHRGRCKYCQKRLIETMWNVQDSIYATMD